MSLPTPVLDDRDFESLMAEARARIPAFTPEWTNFNDSDPGMALAQLHAWLTEALLFQVNRLPDMAYVRFLNLIGTEPAPARAARAELTFRFADLSLASDPLTILVPKGTQAGVKDPALKTPIVFETDETLRGVNAAVAATIAPGPPGGPKRVFAGDYDPKARLMSFPRPFRPFGAAGAEGACLIGLLLRPARKAGESYHLDRFPPGETALSLRLPEALEPGADGRPLPGPPALTSAFPGGSGASGAEGPRILWEICMAASAPDLDGEGPGQWRPLPVRLDETAGLTRSGRILLDMPENPPAHGFMALPRRFWSDLGLRKPPLTREELIEDLRALVFAPADLAPAVWRGPFGIADPDLTDPPTLIRQVADASAFDLKAAPPGIWSELGYSEAPTPHGLIWLRLREFGRPPGPPRELADLRLNAVGATAAQTRRAEILGTSEARPNQSFRLSRAPVLIDPVSGLPDLEIALSPAAGGEPEPWSRVEDFAASGPMSPHYLLDPGLGEIRLGDGIHGRIPVAGARLVALRYRVGGGAAANAAAGAISQLKTALPQVAAVSNARPAVGGADAETLAEAKLRAPSRMRSRDRAVTFADFADLARATPGVALKKAAALPLTAVDRSDPAGPRLRTGVPGAVTVALLPDRDEPAPQPTEAEMRLVAAHLDARRLISTELHLIGPSYVRLSRVEAAILVSASADLMAAERACAEALTRYFSPVRGGESGEGWGFGEAIYHGSVFRLLLAQPGVAQVADLRLALEGLEEDPASDVIPLPAEALPVLPPGLLRIGARHVRN